MSDFILHEIDIKPDEVHFYSDSKVALGYICNESRRFYVYVHNRVQTVRQSKKPEQWHYVPSELNPADHASRAIPASQLQTTSWLTGPDSLYKPSRCHPRAKSSFQLVSPDIDTEVHPQPQVTVSSTSAEDRQLGSERFKRISTWDSLLNGTALLVHVARSFQSSSVNQSHKCSGWYWCEQQYL